MERKLYNDFLSIKFLFLKILYRNVKIAMLKIEDYSRFNLCLQTGRRFYAILLLLTRHIDNIGTTRSLSFRYLERFHNENDFTLEPPNAHDQFSLTADDEDIDDEEYSEISSIVLHEAMQLNSGSMFINFYKNIDYSAFEERYCRRYAHDAFKMIYAATKSIIPLELNMNSINIPCEYGEWKRLDGWERIPLIEVLYRSNKVIEMIKKLTIEMMMSSILYVNLYAKSSFGTTSGLNMKDLTKCYPIWKAKDFSIDEKFFSR